MVVNIQIFNDGDVITISEPTKSNNLILRVGTEVDTELTEYLLTYEMVEKIRIWLNEQSRKMAAQISPV